MVIDGVGVPVGLATSKRQLEPSLSLVEAPKLHQVTDGRLWLHIEDIRKNLHVWWKLFIIIKHANDYEIIHRRRPNRCRSANPTGSKSSSSQIS